MYKVHRVENDLMFRQIFGKVGNEKIAKNFLECTFGTNIFRLSLDANYEKIEIKNNWLETVIEEYNYLAENPERQEEFEEKCWE
ncbi:MAG: hypothetical protein HFJ51_02365 [Clostridia bacterium]|nr:hypothetical protein [Clostridia bacterium]